MPRLVTAWMLITGHGGPEAIGVIGVHVTIRSSVWVCIKGTLLDFLEPQMCSQRPFMSYIAFFRHLIL